MGINWFRDRETKSGERSMNRCRRLAHRFQEGSKCRHQSTRSGKRDDSPRGVVVLVWVADVSTLEFDSAVVVVLQYTGAERARERRRGERPWKARREGRQKGGRRVARVSEWGGMTAERARRAKVSSGGKTFVLVNMGVYQKGQWNKLIVVVIEYYLIECTIMDNWKWLVVIFEYFVFENIDNLCIMKLIIYRKAFFIFHSNSLRSF